MDIDKKIEEYSKIWEMLLDTFSDTLNGKKLLPVIFSSNGQEVATKSDIRKLFLQGVGEISFCVVCNYDLFAGLESRWSRFAQSRIETAAKSYDSLDNSIIEHLDKIVINFNTADISLHSYSILREIIDFGKNLHKNINIRFNLSKANSILVEKNDRDNWCKVWQKIRLEGQVYHIFRNYCLYVQLTKEDDVTNLRYFLPLWDFGVRRGIKIKLVIKNDIGMRAFQLFQHLKDEIRMNIEIDDKLLIDKQRDLEASDILPLLLFRECDNPVNSIDYLDIIETYFAYIANAKNYAKSLRRELLEKLVTLINIEVKNINVDYVLKVYQRKNFIAYLKQVKDKNKVLEIQQIEDNDLNELIEEDDEKLSVGQLIAINNKRYYKEREQVDFINFLNVFKDETVNKFTVLIFVVLLRNLIVNRLILNEVNNKIQYNLIESTWSNSKTYAEGLYQLVENAQKHSEGHVAYFGMRIYKANPNIPIGKLKDETWTRTLLWNKYRHERKILGDIFNAIEKGQATFSDFIEFYVLDDAISFDYKARGIVDIIKSNDTLKDKTKNNIYSIGKIFKLTGEEYANELSFFIQHYGMRWFKYHIEQMSGVMEIYSPCVDYNENTGNQCCVFSNVLESNYIEADCENLYSTEYSVLVPLAYLPVQEKNKLGAGDVEDLFLPLNSEPMSKLKVLEPVDITFDIYKDAYHNSKTKLDCIQMVYDNHLKTILSKSLSSIMVQINCENLKNELAVEIFAKALFMLIYNYSGNSDSNKIGNRKDGQLFVAVDFGEKHDFTKEFIRIFSIFYGKKLYENVVENYYMKKAQIAVCSKNVKTKIEEVDFVLAGGRLSSAYETAKNYVYYNAESSLSYLPLLKFISMNKDEKDINGKIESFFPFDLYLKSKDGESWFNKQIQYRLNTDLRQKSYGCKISDISVRLGSKIRIDTFYEAELLFHNVGTIKRFAYLLAKDIIFNLNCDVKNDDTKIPSDKLSNKELYLFLLGYENYSAVLMQEVNRLLINYFGKNAKIDWMIDTRSEDFPVFSFDKYSITQKQEIFEAYKNKKMRCITILPLGSTMSTVYKLQDSFMRGLRKIGFQINECSNSNPIFLYNYCIVAIGDTFKDIENNSSHLDSPACNYLSPLDYIDNNEIKNDLTWHKIKLLPAKKNMSNVTVRFLLSASATWFDLEEESDYSNMQAQPVEKKISLPKPLLQVDKTSTLLSAHFQTPLQDEVLKYYQRSSKVKLLEPKEETSFIKYGHILRGNNHYQFYFDFEKLTNDKRDIIEQFAKSWSKHIESNAYNIVISPLQITNASFLKIILDKTFGSNLHLLHIDINGTGKESIRTKFEYIAAEFFDIVQQNSKINFYYVDDSVCTGDGLARAWKFVLTLCNQSGLNMQSILSNGEKFKKVFLLMNRSSYETAKTWVHEPNEDWCGVINLCIPSYNTHMENNIVCCPGCGVYSRYELLRKRSSTNELISYFSHQTEKYAARNPIDFELWIEDRILNSCSYFRWLCEWIYFNNSKRNDGIYCGIIVFYEYISNTEKLWEKQTIKNFIDFLDTWKYNPKEEPNGTLYKEKSVLSKWLKTVEPKMIVLATMHKIVDKDNYWRLMTMDLAYRNLLYDARLQNIYKKCVDEGKLNFIPYTAELKKKIIQLLANCMKGKNKNAYDAVFLFISYIKVISRDYLAKNYFIKETMYQILEELFETMISSTSTYKEKTEEEGIDEDWKFILTYLTNISSNEKAAVMLKYRIFKTTIHRLALMRSPAIIKARNIKRIRIIYYLIYERNNKAYDNKNIDGTKPDKDILLILPTKKEMIDTYFASIKTATMEENNDNICNFLWKQTKKYINME